jgi:hypothetical protein
MQGWSDEFNSFMGFILIVMFATLFWEAFQKDMEKRNHATTQPQTTQAQVQYVQAPVNNILPSPIKSSQYIPQN